jgi:hypothetical protein
MTIYRGWTQDRYDELKKLPKEELIVKLKFSDFLMRSMREFEREYKVSFKHVSIAVKYEDNKMEISANINVDSDTEQLIDAIIREENQRPDNW